MRGWCCQDDDNVWDEDEISPPCDICPRKNFNLTEVNERIVRVWRLLDMTGRDRFMEEGLLREEAIDCALARYKMNIPPLYERLVYLETMMLEHRQRTRPKDKKSSKTPSKG